MQTEIINIKNIARSKWSGGETAQIYINPIGLTVKDDFLYRISSASVLKGESTFSDFSEYNRFIVILDGSIELSHDDKPYQTLNSFTPYFFDGASITKSKSSEDIIDFNVIYKKSLKDLKFEIVKNKAHFEIETDYFFYNHKDNSFVYIDETDHSLRENEILIVSGLNKKSRVKTIGNLIAGNII